MKYLICSLLLVFQTQAKLLDKIVAIVDDNIITQSQIQRLTKNLSIKRNIAPMIYEKNQYDGQEMLNMVINKLLIRSKLQEIGYSVGDDQVEAQIKANEKRLNVNRDALKNFLKQQNTSFDEYFETLREAIEYSYFVSRIITPTLSVSEQDVKNEYFKRNSKDSRLNFKYNLVDYVVSKENSKNANKDFFVKSITQFRGVGVWSSDFSEISPNNLDDITEEGMALELSTLLKNTQEGQLSKPIMLNGQLHAFFVVKKDLVETESFINQKENVRNDLLASLVKVESGAWFEREKAKHYIKISL